MRNDFLRRQRGSTLIVTVTLIAVLTVVAAGMIRRGNADMDNANARRHYDAGVSCADGARELLMSQFRAYGVDLTNVVLNESAGNRRYGTGHFDQFGVTTVKPVAGQMVKKVGENAMDFANRLTRVQLGSGYYTATVVCTDTVSQRQSEVEFLIRFGL